MYSVLVVVAVAGWFAAGMLLCCLKAGKDADEKMTTGRAGGLGADDDDVI